MTNSSFRPLFVFSITLVVGISLLSCDSAGSNGPTWTGNWSITSVGGVQPDASLDYRITKENFVVVVFTGESCDISEGRISETDGNVLTVSFDGGESQIQAEADDGGSAGSEIDDTITLTVQDGRIPGGTGAPRAGPGDTVEGSGGGGDPREKCP